MKKLIRIGVLVVSVAVFASPTKADNPVNWNFELITYGARDDWNSPTYIDPAYSLYDYQWELTHEAGPYPAVQVLGSWYDIWDSILPGDKSGSDTLGPLQVVDELILHINYPQITADFLVSVAADGYGTISIDNVIFDDITGARFRGNVIISPGPATICLLGLGALLFRQKNYRKQSQT